jgi:hypothetical protein
MDIDEEMRRKIVVSATVVVLVVVGFLAIGATYGGAELDRTGGFALIGVVVTFVVVMAGAGLYLARSG